MKKKLLSVISVVAVMAIAMVSLVACGGALDFDDLVGEDGKIDADKIKSEQVTKEEWNSATHSSIIDSDISFYMTMVMDEETRHSKLIIDGKKVKTESKKGELFHSSYINILDDTKAEIYTQEGDKWTKAAEDYDKADLLEGLMIEEFYDCYDDYTFNEESNQYETNYKTDHDMILAVRFVDGKIAYFKYYNTADATIGYEGIYTYGDQTVTLPDAEEKVPVDTGIVTEAQWDVLSDYSSVMNSDLHYIYGGVDSTTSIEQVLIEHMIDGDKSWVKLLNGAYDGTLEHFIDGSIYVPAWFNGLYESFAYDETSRRYELMSPIFIDLTGEGGSGGGTLETAFVTIREGKITLIELTLWLEGDNNELFLAELTVSLSYEDQTITLPDVA